MFHEYPIGPPELFISWTKRPLVTAEPGTNLVKLDPELSSTLQWGGERIQVLTPESKELLYAQAAQSVVACIANPVLLTHRHHLVVDVQSILQEEVVSTQNTEL